jgi:hypothetical protein
MKFINGAISRQLLRDLRDSHGLPARMNELEVFSRLLSEVEWIASIKYDAGRLEENGDLKIETADLLRYGLRH